MLPAESEHIDAWLQSIRASHYTILATNIVNPIEWESNLEMGKPARDAQKAAIKRKVEIKRIWIYPKNIGAKAKEALLRVSQDQKSIGIKIRYLVWDDISKQEVIQRSIQEVGGTVDVVIYDSERVLLTHTDPTDFSIISGVLTKKSEKVQAAITLFQKLWEEAKEEYRK